MLEKHTKAAAANSKFGPAISLISQIIYGFETLQVYTRDVIVFVTSKKAHNFDAQNFLIIVNRR